jgi:hypothetical protein
VYDLYLVSIYDLKLSLDIAPSGSPEVEFFVRHGEVPDRIHYDYHSYQTLNPHQVIKIPNTQTGTYYVLVSGIHTPSPSSSYTLLATSMAFSIESVFPLAIGDSGQVTLKLYGARFEQGATVALVGPDTCVATKVTIEDRTFAKARFDLDMAEHGLYHVVLVNSAGDSAISTQGVFVEGVKWGDVEINTYGDHGVRPNQELPIFIQIINNNNIDIPYLTLIFGSSEDTSTLHIKLESSWRMSFPSDSMNALFPNNVANENAQFSHITLKDLAPGDTADCLFQLKSSVIYTTVYTYYVSSSRRRADLLVRFVYAVELLRQEIVTHDSLLLSQELQSAVNDSGLWSRIVVSTAVEMGLFDSADVFLSSGNVVTSLASASILTKGKSCPEFFNWLNCASAVAPVNAIEALGAAEGLGGIGAAIVGAFCFGCVH